MIKREKERAEEYLLKAIELEPKGVYVCKSPAEIYVERDNYEEAVKMYANISGSYPGLVTRVA